METSLYVIWTGETCVCLSGVWRWRHEGGWKMFCCVILPSQQAVTSNQHGCSLSSKYSSISYLRLDYTVHTVVCFGSINLQAYELVKSITTVHSSQLVWFIYGGKSVGSYWWAESNDLTHRTESEFPWHPQFTLIHFGSRKSQLILVNWDKWSDTQKRLGHAVHNDNLKGSCWWAESNDLTRRKDLEFPLYTHDPQRYVLGANWVGSYG